MHDDYDRGAKWMIQHHGDGILRLGRIGPIKSWRALAAEVVQPKRLPDGLLEVVMEGQTEPDLFLLEIATYPEPRVVKQMLGNMMLVWLDRRVLPECLTVVLRPRGGYRVPDFERLSSRLGLSQLQAAWRVIELWEVPAQELLAANDVGLLPWLPLTQFDGPPEPLLHQCRERIEQSAIPEERPNLLAVTQVMTQLRYNDPGLLALLGGSQMMIESPLIQELMAQRSHEDIVTVLEGRFGEVSPEVALEIRAVVDPQKLRELVRYAGVCPDLAAFRSRFSA